MSAAAVDVAEVVDRARAGDGDAFGELYARYYRDVFGFIRWRVGRDHQAAEDLTADVFLRAFAAIGRWTWQGRDFGAWLTTIARHRVADHFKSARCRLSFAVPFTAAGIDSWFERADVDPAGDPETAAVTADVAAAVRAALVYLTPEQRQCILLRFMAELSIAETAEAMNREQGAVKGLQYRATQALRAACADDLAAAS